MVCILTRLPVKSIIRFKSVCKPWLQLFSTREFLKLHRVQFSSDPKNQSFIVQVHDVNYTNPVFMFNFESNEKRRPKILNLPFPDAEVVGCCNGLCCISLWPSHGVFGLFNPAMNLFKIVWPPVLEERCKMVSLGFGYDDVVDDFKVVRILYLERGEKELMAIYRVEVYSVNSGSWTTIEPGFQFKAYRTESFLSVNEKPYWYCAMDGEDGDALVCFDVKKLVFQIVPEPLTNDFRTWQDSHFIDWNGSLGALVFTQQFTSDEIEYVDIFVFDDVKQIWRKTHTFETPVEMKPHKICHCLKNGKIVFSHHVDDKPYTFDFETGLVKPLFYGIKKPECFHMHDYIESLAYVEGMELARAGKRTKKRKMIDGATSRN